MTIEEYARKILADYGCDEYTYGGKWSEHVLSDLKEGYPDGMEFPYIDVANAILAISHPEPIKRDQWKMVFDADGFCDGIGFESFGSAKADAEDTLIMWMCEERVNWADAFNPTDEELDNYNYKIYNCSVRVEKYNPDTDEYDVFWSPSYEDEETLGWRELTREILEDEKKRDEEYRKNWKE